MVRPGDVDLFAAKAAEAGARVERAGSLTQAGELIARLLQDNGWTKVVSSTDLRPFVSSLEGVDRLEPESPAGYGRVEVGIIWADHGVAATGTVARWDSNDKDRLAATMAPFCVCLLRQADIVAELEDIAGEMDLHLGSGQAPGFRQVSLITGPSRTADIENELTLGVHGPGQLRVIIIEE